MIILIDAMMHTPVHKSLMSCDIFQVDRILLILIKMVGPIQIFPKLFTQNFTCIVEY
jgi:hypothetical protein